MRIDAIGSKEQAVLAGRTNTWIERRGNTFGVEGVNDNAPPAARSLSRRSRQADDVDA